MRIPLRCTTEGRLPRSLTRTPLGKLMSYKQSPPLSLPPSRTLCRCLTLLLLHRPPHPTPLHHYSNFSTGNMRPPTKAGSAPPSGCSKRKKEWEKKKKTWKKRNFSTFLPLLFCFLHETFTFHLRKKKTEITPCITLRCAFLFCFLLYRNTQMVFKMLKKKKKELPTLMFRTKAIHYEIVHVCGYCVYITCIH